MATDAAPAEPAGQASEGTATQQTTGAAPAGDNGQGTQASSGNGTSGTTGDGSASQSTEQTFFDPRELDPALMPAYKQMQAAFTKRMQALSGEANKAKFFDEFAKDPVGNIQRIAQQYGYSLTRAQAQAAIDGKQDTLNDWQPQSWEEVMSKAEERAAQKIFGKLQPVFGELREQKKQNIERQLTEIDPAWQQYEQEMSALIQEVPELALHPEKLYRLAVPQDVIEARATQRAIAKLEAKTRAAGASGGSTTTKTPSAVDPNQRFGSVQEAAAWAQKKLEAEGKWPPK